MAQLTDEVGTRHEVMNLKNKILLIPDKPDEERDAVAEAWRESGGKVIRLARFWEPPDLKDWSVSIYGGSNFSLVVAQKLRLKLISPADDWLLTLDSKWLKRRLCGRTLEDVENISFPVFAKPLIPKTFRAAVYNSAQELLAECKGLEHGTKLIAAEVVHFEAEARAFVAKGRVLDCQIYEGIGNVQNAKEFVCAFIEKESLPPTCVLDVGLMTGKAWVFVEANASWGAGLNGCNASRVLPAIERATETGA